MSDILIIFFMILIGFCWGWISREQHAIKQVKKMRASGLIPEITTVEDVEKNDFIPIQIEYHNDTFYVYIIKDKSFMAQGKTQQIVEKNLAERFPNKRFAALPENLKEIGFDT